MNFYKQLTYFIFFYVLFFLVSISISVPRFGTNDDFFFNELLSGAFTGEPYFFTNMTQSSPRTIFSLPVWALYNSLGYLNWYYFCLAGVVIISLAVVSTVLRTVSVNKEIIWLVFSLNIFISLFVLFWWAAAPTYTAAAFFPAIAAGSLFLLLPNKFEVSKYKLVVVAAIFVSISISIRLESSFIPLAVIVFPIVVSALIRDFKAFIKPVILFSSIVVSTHLVNEISQNWILASTPEWRYYNEFEEIRYQIHENKYQRLMNDYPDQFGWNHEKVQLFLTYNFADKNIFSNQEMKILDEKLFAFSDQQVIRWEDIKRRIDARVGPFQDLWKIIFLFSVFVVIITRNKEILFMVFTSNFIFALVSFYVLVNLRSPERIIVPSLVTLFFSLIFILSRAEMKNNLSILSFLSYNLLPIVFMLVYLLPLYDFQYKRSITSLYRDFATAQAAELSQISGDAIFVGGASQFRWDWTNPYDYKAPPYDFLPTGIFTFSPPWNEKVRNLELNAAQLYLIPSGRDDIYFLASEETTQNLISLYIEELEVALELTSVLEKNFDFSSYNVFKFKGR